MVGGLSLIIDISFLFVLREIFQINLILAITLAFLVTSFVNYLLSIKFVFVNLKYSKEKEIILFYFFAFFTLIITIGLMYLFVNVFGLWYIYSKISIVIFVSVISFIVRKFLIFYR